MTSIRRSSETENVLREHIANLIKQEARAAACGDETRQRLEEVTKQRDLLTDKSELFVWLFSVTKSHTPLGLRSSTTALKYL